MNWFEALVLGIVQGLTEFLPVSSSGHLELGKALLDLEVKENMTFTILVHGATVISTLAVFWRDIKILLKDLFKFRWNPSTRFILLILVSMIPVLIVGLLFDKQVESLFSGNLLFVGLMLWVTALFLVMSGMRREHNKEITFFRAILIGLSQALAVIPGISRSGATISTGLLLGVKRDEVARFSFLMVILPIIGANILDLFKYQPSGDSEYNLSVMLIGFFAALISGFLACRWMLAIIRRGKLIYFAIYCALIGSVSIIFSLIG